MEQFETVWEATEFEGAVLLEQKEAYLKDLLGLDEVELEDEE